MSGTLIPLMGTAVDPWTPMQKWQNVLATEANRYKTNAETVTEQQRPALVQAQTGLAGAQTGLVGAQTTGAQIQNALAGLQYQFRGGALDPSMTGAGGGNASGYQIFPQGNNTGTGMDLVTPGGGGTAPAQAGGGGGGGGGGTAAAPGGVGGKTAADVPPVGGDATGGGVTSGNSLAAYSTTAEPVAPGSPGAPAPPNALASPGVQPPGGGAVPPGGQQQADLSMQTSPNGMIHPLIGVPLPRQAVFGVLSSTDPIKAAQEAQAARRAYLANAAASTTDLPTWNAAVQREFSLGYITRGDAQALYGHPEYRDAVIRANSSPDTQVGYNQALVGHGLQESPTGPQLSPTALAVKPPIEQEIQVPKVGTDGKTYYVTQKVSIPAGSYAASTLGAQGGPGGMGGGGGGGAPGGPPGGPPASPNATPVGQYLTHLAGPGGGEGGGNPNAQNPNSSAGGLLQFTDESWLNTIKQARPDIAAGKTDAQLLALKKDPTLNLQMGVPYTQANLARLGQIGVPQNEATARLAHWFGPDGASTLLHAQQATPLGQLFPAKLLADNKLNPATPAGDLIRSVVGQYGLKSIDFGQGGSMGLVGGGPAAKPAVGPSPGAGSPAAGGAGGGGAVAPAGAGGSTLGANPTGVALPPGTSVGNVTLTPEQQAGLDVKKTVQEAAGKAPIEADTTQLANDSKTIQDGVEAAQSLQRGQAQLFQVRDLGPLVDAGAGASARMAINNYFETFGGDWAKKFAEAVLPGVDPSKAAWQQEFVKLTLQQAGSAEQQTLGSKGGFRAIELYRKAFPSMETQPQAIHDMTNLLIVAHQRDLDYTNGQTQYFNNQRQGFLADPANNRYQPLSNYDQGVWGINDPKSVHAPEVYVAAAKLLNDKNPSEAFKGLTPEQQAEAVRIRFRSDPSGSIKVPGSPTPAGAK